MITAVADTHTIIWYIYADDRLSDTAKLTIENAEKSGHQVGVSAITLIEMVYLVEKGRITSESFSLVAASLHDENLVFEEVEINLEIARSMSAISAKQIPDMPDRIIAATAQYLNVPVISRDSKIQLSSVQTVW